MLLLHRNQVPEELLVPAAMSRGTTFQCSSQRRGRSSTSRWSRGDDVI